MRKALVALGLGMAMLLFSWGTSAMESRATAAAVRHEIRPEQILPGDSVVMLSYDGQAAHLPGLKGTAAWASLEETELMDRMFELLQAMVAAAGEEYGEILRCAIDHLRAEGMSLGISLGADGDYPAPYAVVVFHEAAELAESLEPFLTLAMTPAEPQISVETIDGHQVNELELDDVSPEVERAIMIIAGDEPAITPVRPQISEATIDGRQVRRLELHDVSPGMELAWWSEGAHLVFAVGMNSVHQTLATIAGDRPSLAGQPQWQTLRQSDEFTVTGLGWIDVGSVLDRFGGMELTPNATDEVTTVHELLQIPGLDAVDGLFMQMGFQGAATWTKTDVKWRGEPRGLMRLLDQRPLQLSELPPLPPAVARFSWYRFDAGAALQTMLDVYRQLAMVFEPESAGEFDEALGAVGEVVGMQPQDLLNSFGDVWCFYSDTAALPIPIGISPALAVSVRDRDVIAERLTALTQAAASTGRELAGDIAGELAGEMAGELAGDIGFEVRPFEKDGVSYWALKIPSFPVVPTLMLTDDWFVAGITPVTAQTFAARLQGKLPSWEPDDVLAEGLAELPSEMMSLTYSDPSSTYVNVLQLAPIGMVVLQHLLGVQGVEMPFEIYDLPVPELVTAPLFPNLSVTVRSEVGLTSLSRQSVPETSLGDLSGLYVLIMATWSLLDM